MLDIERPITAQKFGELTGLSERRVRELKSAGILVSAGRGIDAPASLQNYCSHLREQAAGRAVREGGRLDLKQETAKLKVSQRKHYDLRNAVIEKTHIPLAVLEPAWARAMRAVRGGILAAPGRIRFALRHLTAHDQQVVDDVLRDVLTKMADAPPRPDVDDRE